MVCEKEKCTSCLLEKRREEKRREERREEKREKWGSEKLNLAGLGLHGGEEGDVAAVATQSDGGTSLTCKNKIKQKIK